jgi:DNA transposition AAA+ family ATPase
MNTNAERAPSAEPPEKSFDVGQGKIRSIEKPYQPPMREEAIAARLADMRDAGMKTLAMANEAGLEVNTLKRWISGQREQEVTKALSDWLTGIDDEIAARDGEFVLTPSSARFVKAFEQARAPRGKDGRRGIALIYGASGAGKTETAKWQARMDENVIYVQADGERKTFVSLLRAVVEEKTGYGGHPAVGEKMRDHIIRNFQPGSMLIFDQANLIRLTVMEQLIIFPDEYGIALAFIGNAKGYKALMDAKMAQITSRIAGAHIFVEIPGEEDIDALLEAWSVAGRQERKFCMMIGRQDGGLRYLDATVREARKLAHAAGSHKLDARLLKLGAVNAGCWGGAE